MRIQQGSIFGTLQRADGQTDASDFELTASAQCNLDAAAHEDERGVMQTKPFVVSCRVPGSEQALTLTLPVQPEARDAARWYLFVDHDVLVPGTPLEVAFSCNGSLQPHQSDPAFPNAASLRVSVVTGIRFEHEGPEADYDRLARLNFHSVLRNGCLLDLNGDLIIVQKASDWRQSSLRALFKLL